MTDVSHSDIQRAIGRLEGKVDSMADARKERDGNIDDRFGRVEEKLDRVEVDLRAIREVLDKAKGGWKALVIIGGIAGAVASWVIPAFVKKLLGL